MNSYDKTLKEALQEQGMAVAEVAKQVGIKKGRLQSILDGEKQLSMEELIAISSYVSFDINQFLRIKETTNEYLVIDDPLQIKLNTITRSIKKENQKDFVKAVEYLADCFTMKEKQK